MSDRIPPSASGLAPCPDGWRRSPREVYQAHCVGGGNSMSADQFLHLRDRRPEDVAVPAEAIQQDADAGDVGFVKWLAEHPWALVLCGFIALGVGFAAGLGGSIAGVF